ncbi:DUF1254 domain-containing protein [Sphingoaurantiacus capsulatus]|uniref:DUF1254 domain-containing protein n=1 Tax=Sphingoaurantiacus capsulatus TaxID=1771310 RepID=A0ABV7X4Q4_9SPHN
MIGRWMGPLIAAVLVAAVGYYATLALTPQLLMRSAWNRVATDGANAFAFPSLATDQSRAIVRPSPDLAYASCPFDVSDKPLLVEVPPVPSAYWSLSVFDAETNVAFVKNNADSRGGTIKLAIALPAVPTPAGYERVVVNSPRGIALVRILVEDRATFPAIDAARQKASCRLG